MSETAWRKVEDELPEMNATVLGACKYRGKWEIIEVYRVSYNDKPMFDSPHDAGMYPPVSHWMPVPKPPED